MQPQSSFPTTPPPAPQQNPYDFIMNDAPQQPKKPFTLPTGTSKTKKLLILGGGGIVGLILIFMVISLLFGGSGKNQELLTIAQEQVEILRVTELAKNERAVRDSTTQALIANTSLSVQSSHQQVLALLKKSKVKTNDKILALKKNSKTDAALVAAARNNNYDEVFVAELQKLLTQYRNDLKKLYPTASKTQKPVLEAAFKGTVILLGEQAK